MKDTLLELAKRAYANTTVYRLVWTTVQVGAGVVAAKVFDDPVVGLAVTILATAITSVAREKLAARKAA